MRRRINDDLKSWGCAWFAVVYLVLCIVAVITSLWIGGCFDTEADAAEPAPPKISAEAAQVRLGYEVFFDARVLSIQGTMSCASCHNPDPKFGYSDGRKVAVGQIGATGTGLGLLGVRNTRTLVNSSGLEKRPANSDGRAPGLYAQCFQAVTDPLVLGMPSVQATVDRVNSVERYRDLAAIAYKHAYVTEAELRQAVVAFLKTLNSNDLPADRLAAGEETALPAAAVRGWKVFQKHCIVCHDPKNDWRDYQFHNIGISSRSRSTDRGRGAITTAADNWKFATPTLREIAKTRPYMHNGSLSSLEEVVGFFANGGKYVIAGRVQIDPNIDPLVAAIEFNAAEASDLKAFLELGFQGANYPYRANPHRGPAQ